MFVQTCSIFIFRHLPPTWVDCFLILGTLLSLSLLVFLLSWAMCGKMQYILQYLGSSREYNFDVFPMPEDIFEIALTIYSQLKCFSTHGNNILRYLGQMFGIPIFKKSGSWTNVYHTCIFIVYGATCYSKLVLVHRLDYFC